MNAETISNIDDTKLKGIILNSTYLLHFHITNTTIAITTTIPRTITVIVGTFEEPKIRDTDNSKKFIPYRSLLSS